MYHIVVFTLLCKLASVELNPLSDNFIDLINKEGKWKAGRNFPADTPMEYIKGLVGAHWDPDELKKVSTVKYDPEFKAKLPESFDAREKWPDCPTLNEIRDQGACGSCWALSSVEAMTDRVCIHSNATKHFHFSAEDAVTCNTQGFECFGGSFEVIWKDWVDKGFVSGGNYNSQEGCKPYTIPTCENHMTNCTKYKPAPSCVESCREGYDVSYEKDKKRGKSYYTLWDAGEIMAEIYKNGPVVSPFDVFEDFANYKSGVYQRLKDAPHLGLHAVKTLGWGVENGTKYWLCANSWGTGFGDNGFFKTLRNETADGITVEKFAVAGEPLIEDY